MRLPLSIVLSLFPLSAAAQDLTLSYNGHDLGIVRHPEGGVIRSLVVDGMVVIADQYWIGLPEYPVEVAGVPVMVFETHPGGNACEGSFPLVVSLPADAPATFWGPLDNCAPVEVIYESGRIRFVSLAGEAEQVWMPGMP